MGKIDTSGWKEFRVGDLFAAERGKVKNIQPLCPGETPIIAAGAYNQGIAGMYEIDSAYENRITISCNGAGCGSTFYHPYKFNVNGDAVTLIEKSSMSDKAKSFIACILNGAFTRKYSYEEKCSPQKALDEIVRLPATHDGAPDWSYMESYMANLESKVAESLTLLQAAKDAEKKKVDTREWGEFRVGELFAQERGKEKAPKQNEPGDCPLIQETNNNSGFDRMVVPTKVIKGNSITVSINYAQNVFYQADDFCASVNIAVLRNSHLNRYNSQFVCSVLRNAHQKFDYTSKISKELLNKEMIMLPVDKTGQPDWAYMEEYMRKVDEKAKNVLNHFEKDRNGV